MALWLFFMELLFKSEEDILKELLLRPNLRGETIFEYAEHRACGTLLSITIN